MNKNPLIFTFIISLFVHCLFLFIPRFDFIPSPLKEWKDVIVEIEIKQRTEDRGQKTENKIKEAKSKHRKKHHLKKEKVVKRLKKDSSTWRLCSGT